MAVHTVITESDNFEISISNSVACYVLCFSLRQIGQYAIIEVTLGTDNCLLQ